MSIWELQKLLLTLRSSNIAGWKMDPLIESMVFPTRYSPSSKNGWIFQPTNMIYQGVTLTYVSKPEGIPSLSPKPTRKPFKLPSLFKTPWSSGRCGASRGREFGRTSWERTVAGERGAQQKKRVTGFPRMDVPGRKLGSMVRISGLFHLPINGGFCWGCNPLTNHLLSSCDIQVGNFIATFPAGWENSQKVGNSKGIRAPKWPKHSG